MVTVATAPKADRTWTLTVPLSRPQELLEAYRRAAKECGAATSHVDRVDAPCLRLSGPGEMPPEVRAVFARGTTPEDCWTLR